MPEWSPYQPAQDGLPPQEVHFIELKTEPWPGQPVRVRVHLEITPFLERPNIHAVIARDDRAEISSIHIIETIETRMVFTMHLRGEAGDGPLTLTAKLYYPDTGTVDEKTVTVNLPSFEAPAE
jgi:hypothetical protein